jgi:hypothetical protein
MPAAAPDERTTMDDTPAEKAVVLGRRPAPGRTRLRVRCTCGHVKDYFVWGWAGRGHVVCPSCKSHIIYGSLAVRKP